MNHQGNGEDRGNNHGRTPVNAAGRHSRLAPGLAQVDRAIESRRVPDR